MKHNYGYMYRTFLAVGDILSLVASFTIAYVLRVTFMIGSVNAPHFSIPAMVYINTVVLLLPFWLLLFYMLGLYSPAIYTHRPRELGRLLIAAALGVIMMLAVSYYTNTPLFPSQLVSVYAVVTSFVVLVATRTLLRYVRLKFLDHGIGTQKVLIVGNNDALEALIEQVADNPRTGYSIVGVVTRRTLPLTLEDIRVFPTLHAALETLRPDVIMQTDGENSDETYETAVTRHMVYQYLPAHKALATSRHSAEVIGSLPIIVVHTTPLIGSGRLVKRTFDIVASSLAIICFSPLMLLIAGAVKLTDGGTVLMQGVMANRVTRYNRIFRLYKFRSHHARFDGKTDEEVFRMVGKPELIQQYRQNGDKLDNDFRVTPVGRFLRRFSLDELPQLFNVLCGDLSLVGPRALVPHEIDAYAKSHTILSVKSGMTGLAVISGRRSISFNERRSLDVYYVQNWSFWLDISILLRTVRVIFSKESTP